MRASLVSCIVPAFNGEEYIAAALDSILRQRHQPQEVIVVDDGSTDRTPEILARYRDEIRVVRQSNAGPAAARNHGLSLAQGEFVAFLDQDDYWHGDKLVRQVAHLGNAQHVDVSVSRVESFWTPSGYSGAERRRDQPRGGAVPGYVTGTMLARRVVFDRVGSFRTDCRYADSLDWFVRAAECGVVVELLPDVLLFHRVHDRNLSRDGDQSRAECLRIIKGALHRRRAASPR